MGVAHMLEIEGAEPALSGLGPRRPMLRPSDILFFGADAITDGQAETIEASKLAVKGVFSTYIKAAYPTEGFWTECQVALEGLCAAVASIGIARNKPGTMRAVVAAYFQAPEFLALA